MCHLARQTGSRTFGRPAPSILYVRYADKQEQSPIICPHAYASWAVTNSLRRGPLVVSTSLLQLSVFCRPKREGLSFGIAGTVVLGTKLQAVLFPSALQDTTTDSQSWWKSVMENLDGPSVPLACTVWPPHVSEVLPKSVRCRSMLIIDVEGVGEEKWWLTAKSKHPVEEDSFGF